MWDMLRNASSEDPRPPVLLVPGLVSSRLIAWKKKACRGPHINPQDIVWLNLQKMIETATFDPHCWIDCMKLGPNGTDPDDCKLRADEGLGAIGELSPGNIFSPATSVFNPLIKMLAEELGYDVNTIIGAPYDWRLAPINLEDRDSFFTTLKFKLETSVKRHRRPAIVMAHSMGSLLFLYFIDWLRYIDQPPGGYERWLQRHVWALVGYAAPLLGAPIALKSVISGHNFGLTITEEQSRGLHLSCPSSHFLNPRSAQSVPGLSSSRSGTSGQSDVVSAFVPPFTSTSSSTKSPTITAAKQSLFQSFPHDYLDPLVKVISHSGGSQISFDINDVENGEIFKWLGNVFKEPLLHQKYDSLQALFRRDPLKPLQVRFARPPIRHVIMIYGVDLPTEVGYVYRYVDGKGTDNDSGGSSAAEVVLEEVLYEEPCGIYSMKDANPNHLSTRKDMSTALTAVPGRAEGAKSVGGSEDADNKAESSKNNSNQSIAANTHASVGEPIFCNQSVDNEPTICVDKTGDVLDQCYDDGTDIQVEQLSYEQVDFILKVNRSRNCTDTIIANETADNLSHHNHSILTKEAIRKYKNKHYFKNCKSEVHSVRTKKSKVTTNKNRKQFIRFTNQSHSGDITVPYVSLSYAHVWLSSHPEGIARTWEEHKPEKVHTRPKGWSPLKIPIPGLSTSSAALDTFHSEAFNGDTTVVVEAMGVDHTEVVKDSDIQAWIFDYLVPKMVEDFKDYDVWLNKDSESFGKPLKRTRKRIRVDSDNKKYHFHMEISTMSLIYKKLLCAGPFPLIVAFLPLNRLRKTYDNNCPPPTHLDLWTLVKILMRQKLRDIRLFFSAI